METEPMIRIVENKAVPCVYSHGKFIFGNEAKELIDSCISALVRQVKKLEDLDISLPIVNSDLLEALKVRERFNHMKSLCEFSASMKDIFSPETGFETDPMTGKYIKDHNGKIIRKGEL